MADDTANDAEDPEAAEGQATGGGKKKLIVLSGGAMSLLATAFVLALTAVPDPGPPPGFEGPFVAPLTAEKVQVNVGKDKTRFYVFTHNVVFEAYEEGYFAANAKDPVLEAYLVDTLIGLAASRDMTEMYEGAYEAQFREEIRAAVEPLLFPIHVGQGKEPMSADPASGIGPGPRAIQSTFRGPWREHLLKVDAKKRTISVDDGPAVTWEGSEVNLGVYTAAQEVLYLDVSRAVEDYQGELRVGVKGRIKTILKKDQLLQ